MLLITYAFVLAILSACLYALFVCARITFYSDFSYVKDEGGSAIRNGQAGKFKFAALYGVSGLCGIAWLLYAVSVGLPLGRWSYVISGFFGVFSGLKWFVIRSHSRATNSDLAPRSDSF